MIPMMVGLRSAATLSMASLLIGTAVAGSVDVAFTRIADTSTPVPSGIGTFTSFETYSIDPSGIAFVANGTPTPSPQVGIYLWSAGTITRIADRTVRAPFGTNFSDLDDVSIENGALAFHAFANNSGIYLCNAGTISRVAASGTSMPGGGSFETVESHMPISAGRIAFWGRDNTGRFGVYRRIGATTEIIATESTPVPSANVAFKYINGDSIAMRNGSTIAFTALGSDDTYGLYRFQDGVLTAVADRRGTLPDGRGNIWVGDFFGGPAVDVDEIVFVGSSPLTLYRDRDGQLTPLVGWHSPMPGGGLFQSLRAPSTSNGRVAFWGLGMQGEEGLYTVSQGRVDKIVAIGDPLDGSTMVNSAQFGVLAFGTEALSGNSFVFRANLADGRQGLYLATITPKSPTLDSDADGLPDLGDNCDAKANPGQADADDDGFGDACDNCILEANADQSDADRDGYGNFCDADLNNSGLVTTADFAQMRAVMNMGAMSTPAAAAADMNVSGAVTTADFNMLRSRMNTAPGPSGLRP